MRLGTEVGLGPCDIVLDGDPAPSHGKGHSIPHFSVHFYCGQTVAHLSNCSELWFQRESGLVVAKHENAVDACCQETS